VSFSGHQAPSPSSCLLSSPSPLASSSLALSASSTADGSVADEVVVKEMPDLITLDLGMPEEWGPRFYRKLTQNPELKRIPVIVISGLSANKYAIPKAVASLSKPFDPDQLMRIVKDTIG